MKRLIYLLLSALLMVGCSVTNRIIVTDHEEDGLKSIRLIQSPEAGAGGAGKGQAASSFKEVSTIYLLEEKTAARPQITLETDISTQMEANKSEGSVRMILDHEEIPLTSYESSNDSLQGTGYSSAREKFKQKYLIPENLWISIVHSREISYRLPVGEEGFVHIFLNQKEKEKLSEFMKMAIRQRDLRFPTVPEGQVKW